MDRDYFMKNLWAWKSGKREEDLSVHPYREIDRETEWSPEFETLMRNRLLMGGIRYGKIGARNKPQYNRVRAAKQRLAKYNDTGNLEYLVDVANMCLLEFVESNHPLKHFNSIDGGDHVNPLKK